MTHPMRDLAAKLLDVARDHEAYTQGYDIVRNCAEHLCALAANHERDNPTPVDTRTIVQRRYDDAKIATDAGRSDPATHWARYGYLYADGRG